MLLTSSFLAFAAATPRTPTTQPTTKPAPRPTVAIALANCVTPECHAGIKSHQVLHGPIATNACDNCHQLKDAKAHTFELTRQKAELCTYCHEFSTAGKPVVHKPVSLGECTACHDPHGGPAQPDARRLGGRQPARCHDSRTRGAKFLHTPAAKGAL